MTYVQRNGRDRDGEREWRAAVYLRLSREDGDKPESDSVSNQRAIIEDHIAFLRGQGEDISPADYYTDDGWSGGTFARPGFLRMIRDIEAGKINCVIFKDSSRLGRNYPELGRLMEEYFPRKEVRVISVLGRVDSFKDPYGYSSALVSFTNMMNDDYIRQLSLKIKSTFAMKRSRGEFLGNYAPYGYRKSPEDPHRLVIDPEAAEVVRRIFGLAAGGLSAAEIVRRLDAAGVPPPSAYKAGCGCGGFSDGEKWAASTVRAMLRNEVYIGNLIQGRRKSESYRTKRMVRAEEREWTVVEGAHEPIVSEGLFAAVHERLARRAISPPGRREVYPLSGLLRCARCGGRMNRQTSGGHARYRCMTRARSPEGCLCPSVREEYMEGVLLEVLRRELRDRTDAGEVVRAAEKLAGARAPNGARSAAEKARRELERLRQARFRLFDKWQEGLIGEEEYRDFKTRYDREIAARESGLARLAGDGGETEDELVRFFREHGCAGAPDRELFARLIDRVEFTDEGHIDVFCAYTAGEPVCRSAPSV